MKGPGSFKPVSRDALYTKIADAIVDYIKANQLKEGDKIPSERVLAEQFATSRNSVREALRVLENEKIIQVKTGKGAFITSNAPTESIFMKLWKVDYEEILEVKYMLEQDVVEKLCQSITSDQMAELEEPLLQMEKAAGMGFYLRKEDYIFHRRLRHLSNNATLEQLIDNLVQALDSYGNALKGVEGYWIATIPYHRAIVEGIKDSDYVKASNACCMIYELDLKAIRFVDVMRNEFD